MYVNVPMHNSGGPGNFLKSEMGWEVTRHQFQETNNDAKLIGWTANLMKETCLNFGQEWTPNMLENVTCKTSRHHEKMDVHYLLPWTCVDSGDCNTYHQLESEFMATNSVIGNYYVLTELANILF